MNFPHDYGKYIIHEEIGRGGFAVVYRAEDKKLGRDVALKVLDPLLVRDPHFLKRFHFEARAAARLRHPHIVTIYEMDEVNGSFYIAMDLVPGLSLKQHLRKHKALAWEEAWLIFQQIAQGLDAAHQQGVVHRDLKPANILMDPKTGAILTDFGFARLVGESSEYTMSLSGGVVGTPAYLPVEVWEGRKAGPPADVYALGCILYEMVTGKTLFAAETPIAAMRQHDRGATLPEEWGIENLPANFNPILERALEHEPSKRYQTAGEFLDILEEEIQQEPVEDLQRIQLLSEIENYLKTEEWGDALMLIGQLLGKNPDDIDALTLKVKAQDGLAVLTVYKNDTGNKQRDLNLISAVATSEIVHKKIEIPYIEIGDSLLNMEWCFVPAGQFTMGSNENGNEKPIHSLILTDYYLARYPVTNIQYGLFVNENGYGDPQWWTDIGWAWLKEKKIKTPKHWEDKKWNGDRLPVVGVSWYEATAFCCWASGITGRLIHLPTEAEWEKGARGNDERRYPWGDNWKKNNCTNWENNILKSTPVGQYSPHGDSPYGCYDMSGNVWEWCSSLYLIYPYKNHDGREDKNSTNARVLRGGSWNGDQRIVSTTHRNRIPVAGRYEFVGFRCASDSSS